MPRWEVGDGDSISGFFFFHVRGMLPKPPYYIKSSHSSFEKNNCIMLRSHLNMFINTSGTLPMKKKMKADTKLTFIGTQLACRLELRLVKPEKKSHHF